MHLTDFEKSTAGEAVERSLAMVGFVTLVAGGIWLAIYSSRFVPTTVNSLGAAAVALSSVFVPSDATLAVVPTATTTLPFVDETPATTTLAKPIPTSSDPTPNKPAPVVVVTPIQPIPVAPVLFGLPDLSISVIDIGYNPATSTDATRAQDFIVSSTTPVGMAPSIKFNIKNIGTNVMPAGWHFFILSPVAIQKDSGSIPFELLPGEDRGWVTAIDPSGLMATKPTITITIDPGNQFLESSKDNNSLSTTFTIIPR